MAPVSRKRVKLNPNDMLCAYCGGIDWRVGDLNFGSGIEVELTIVGI